MSESVRIHSVLRQRGGQVRRVSDAIATEVPVSLVYNGEPFAVMMATPNDLADFALGFSYSEAIVRATDPLVVESVDEHLEGVSIRMRIPPEQAQKLASRRRNLTGRSGCGLCGSEQIEAVLRPVSAVVSTLQIDVSALQRSLREMMLRQPINARTGATHAAAWADGDGQVLLVREDVGRHNALDKLIGALLNCGTDMGAGFVVVSSRASYELVQKAAQASIGLLAAISAPTALAITLAESAGLTLVGFAREDGQAVYCHPHRLRMPDALEEGGR